MGYISHIYSTYKFVHFVTSLQKRRQFKNILHAVSYQYRLTYCCIKISIIKMNETKKQRHLY